MLITSENALQKQNGPDCTVREYPFETQNLGLAVAHIKGRYPTHGKSINHECETMYYISEGTGIIHTEDGDFRVKQGDAFLFEKGKRYRIETTDLKIVLPTSPSRYADQYEELP